MTSKFIHILLLSVLATCLVGQQKQLPGSEVEVVKDFDARLADARKLRIPVAFPSRDTMMQRPKISSPGVFPVEINYEPPMLRPLAYRTDPPKEGKNGYAKLGYGFPKMPFAEASYHFDNGENFYMTASAFHHSAEDRNREWKKFGDTRFGIDGGYLLESGMLVSADLNYMIQDRYLYAISEALDTLVSENDIRRKFRRFEAKAGISNYTPTLAGIDYRAGLHYQRISGDQASNEDNFLIYLGGTKWIAERHQLSLDVGLDQTRLRDTLTRTLNNVYIRPNFTWHEKQFSIRAGVNIEVHDDEYYFFPNAEIKYRILKDKMIAFANAWGQLEKNNFYTLSEINPWIDQQIDTLSNAHNLKFGLGVRGRIDAFTYEAGVRYVKSRTGALFVNKPADTLQFGIRTDDIDLLGIGANVEWNGPGPLKVMLEFEKRFYTLTDELEPWYLPTFEASATASYTLLREKLTVGASLFYEDGVFYETETGGDDQLNALFDLSFQGTYNINQTFSLFLEVNNVFNNERERYRGYDTFGFNALGGVMARF